MISQCLELVAQLEQFSGWQPESEPACQAATCTLVYCTTWEALLISTPKDKTWPNPDFSWTTNGIISTILNNLHTLPLPLGCTFCGLLEGLKSFWDGVVRQNVRLALTITVCSYSYHLSYCQSSHHIHHSKSPLHCPHQIQGCKQFLRVPVVPKVE